MSNILVKIKSIQEQINDLYVEVEVLINQSQGVVKFTPAMLKLLYNQYAERNNWPQVQKITTARQRGINSALKVIPRKDQWERVFNSVESDDFWSKIFDFDKIYRNNNYLNFYEKAENKTKKQEELSSLFLGGGQHVN